MIIARLRMICASLTVIGLIFASMSNAIDMKNIAGAWLFDEGRGNVVVDSSGNGNDGELIGDPKWVGGRFGSALAFDGVGAYVNVPHSSSLQITDTVSISIWVKRTRIALDLVLDKGGDWTTGQCNYGMGLHNVNDNMFYFFFKGGWKGTPGVSDMDWHHYVIVAKNGESDISLYIDGVLKPVKSSDGVGTVALSPSDRDLHIGAQIDPQWKYFSANIIDEVAIFDVALTNDEVKSLMRGLSFIRVVSPSGKLTATWAGVKEDR